MTTQKLNLKLTCRSTGRTETRVVEIVTRGEHGDPDVVRARGQVGTSLLRADRSRLLDQSPARSWDVTIDVDVQARDNHGYRYDVEIRNGALDILGTPGKWNLDTVRAHRGSVIALDFGQDWNCVNFDEVLAAAERAVDPELAELNEIRERMIEAERNMSDEARAEMAFEMRAAFGPGVEVVNVLTGKKYTT